MSSKGPGAQYEWDGPDLQDAVTGLLSLSIEDRGHLNICNVSTCNEKSTELISYVNDQIGMVTEVLSQIANSHYISTISSHRKPATAYPAAKHLSGRT